MFREIRRKKQLIAPGECFEILERNKIGFLAVSGDEGYPYTLPMNYSYARAPQSENDLGTLYLHCAPEGHKIEAIKRDPRVSFCVLNLAGVDPGNLNRRYRSVIAFGQARIVEGDEMIALRRDLHGPGRGDDADEPREANLRKHMVFIEVKIEHLSGKRSARH